VPPFVSIVASNDPAVALLSASDPRGETVTTGSYFKKVNSCARHAARELDRMRLISVLSAAIDCARAAIATIAVTRIFIWNDHV
jgi:hypothetical protein